MPDYYLRRHGKHWEIGQMRYDPKHGDKTVNRREPLARYPTQPKPGNTTTDLQEQPMEDLEDDNSQYWQTVGQWEQWQEENRPGAEPQPATPTADPPF